MRAPRLMVVASILALGCAAERPGPPSSGAPRTAETAAEPAPRAPFEPPDARGFGRAGELVYLEEIVGDAAPGDPLPMLVLIHGRGDRPARGWLPLAPPEPVRVIMPQAPLPHGDGFSWSNELASEATGASGRALARDLSDNADRIAAAVAILKRERPTRGRPIAAGFSQGGMLSFALAVRHPEAFAALMPIAGLLPEALWPSAAPAHAPPVHALHGTADPIVPIAPARAAVAHLARAGYRAELREHEGVRHAISPAMQRELDAWLASAVRSRED